MDELIQSQGCKYHLWVCLCLLMSYVSTLSRSNASSKPLKMLLSRLPTPSVLLNAAVYFLFSFSGPYSSIFHSLGFILSFWNTVLWFSFGFHPFKLIATIQFSFLVALSVLYGVGMLQAFFSWVTLSFSVWTVLLLISFCLLTLKYHILIILWSKILNVEPEKRSELKK